nr:BolA family transcriptional regulator [Oceanococcus sp. HetDA_MAG_MS8]
MMEERFNKAFSPRELSIRDDSAQHAGHAGAASGAGHFFVHIRAAEFAGMPPLARHRAVYAAVDDMMGSEIHALSIDAAE